MAGLAGWALVAPSATVAVARLTHRETRTGILVLEALTPLLTAPALAAVGVAVATRRRVMGAVAAALVLCHLLWLAADVGPSRPLPEGADEAPRLRLFSANLLFTNGDMSGIAAEIREADPDVLALQEVSPLNLARLEEQGALAGYPHRWVAARRDPFGSAILSRLPLEHAGEWRVDEMPTARATVVVGDRRLRLYDVHTPHPFGPGGRQAWERQLGALLEVAEHEPEPLVLAGTVEARTVQVGSLVGGRVVRVHVDEGHAVAAGQVLVTLETETLDRQIAEQQAAIAAARAELAKALAGPRDEEVRKAAAIAENEARNARHYASLFRDGVVSKQLAADAATKARTSAEELRMLR
ncbi:MAG TPA: endonuclease/exonuclease/phosphatase family protein, partial [Acidimicrobiales bacterium]|nr:endonuclease/exonuclease/phosphatase family protein [Acidimicrobiales bacterium]